MFKKTEFINYKTKNTALMHEYEAKARSWLSEFGDNHLAEQIPFFRDGIVSPENWFRKNNTFRPLIILKEVSLGINKVEELPQFLDLWGQPQFFEFAENQFDDIRIGTFPQWQRIAKLLKGMEEIHNGAECCDYYKYDFNFIPGGELYSGDIAGYKQYNRERTANQTYNQIIDSCAVIEIKKLGGGQTVGSDLSLATRYYTEHIDPFLDLLCRQIDLIDPTVVICLGRENGECISSLLKNVKRKTKDRIWIDGYHHTRSSNNNFYYTPLAAYKEHLRTKF